MTKPNEYFPHPNLRQETYKRPSSTVQSNPAGGEVPRGQYENRGPAPRSGSGVTKLEKEHRP